MTPKRIQRKRIRSWCLPEGALYPVDAPTVFEIRAELAGKDLCCWCPLDRECHADLLLALANPEVSP